MCPVIPTSNQEGHQAKNRKGSYVKLSSAVGAILVKGLNTFLEEDHPMTIPSKFGSN
jgi:hypothetical protein